VLARPAGAGACLQIITAAIVLPLHETIQRPLRCCHQFLSDWWLRRLAVTCFLLPGRHGEATHLCVSVLLLLQLCSALFLQWWQRTWCGCAGGLQPQGQVRKQWRHPAAKLAPEVEQFGKEGLLETASCFWQGRAALGFWYQRCDVCTCCPSFNRAQSLQGPAACTFGALGHAHTCLMLLTCSLSVFSLTCPDAVHLLITADTQSCLPAGSRCADQAAFGS